MVSAAGDRTDGATWAQDWNTKPNKLLCERHNIARREKKFLLCCTSAQVKMIQFVLSIRSAEAAAQLKMPPISHADSQPDTGTSEEERIN